jgi:hypothetical protein
MASLMNASDDRTLFSRSLPRRRHRPSHANVRSTLHQIGNFTQPSDPSGRRSRRSGGGKASPPCGPCGGAGRGSSPGCRCAATRRSTARRALGREVLGEVAPLAVGAEDGEDGVDDVPRVGLAGPSAGVDGDVRLDQGPLRVGDVAGVMMRSHTPFYASRPPYGTDSKQPAVVVRDFSAAASGGRRRTRTRPPPGAPPGWCGSAPGSPGPWTGRNTGPTSFRSGLSGGRKSREIPAAARRRRAPRTTVRVRRLAWSSTTTRGTFAHGSARRNPNRPYESHVRAAVTTSSRSGPPSGRSAAIALTRRPCGRSDATRFCGRSDATRFRSAAPGASSWRPPAASARPRTRRGRRASAGPPRPSPPGCPGAVRAEPLGQGSGDVVTAADVGGGPGLGGNRASLPRPRKSRSRSRTVWGWEPRWPAMRCGAATSRPRTERPARCGRGRWPGGPTAAGC